jgi:hypothetical protein
MVPHQLNGGSGVCSPQQLHLQGPPLEVGAVHVRDLELAAGRGRKRGRDRQHVDRALASAVHHERVALASKCPAIGLPITPSPMNPTAAVSAMVRSIRAMNRGPRRFCLPSG